MQCLPLSNTGGVLFRREVLQPWDWNSSMIWLLGNKELTGWKGYCYMQTSQFRLWIIKCKDRFKFHRLIFWLLIRDLLCLQECKQPHPGGYMKRCIRLLAELFTKNKFPLLTAIIQCLLAQQHRTWHHGVTVGSPLFQDQETIFN